MLIRLITQLGFFERARSRLLGDLPDLRSIKGLMAINFRIVGDPETDGTRKAYDVPISKLPVIRARHRSLENVRANRPHRIRGGAPAFI